MSKYLTNYVYNVLYGMIQSLLYISSVSLDLPSAEIHSILEHAQIKNSTNNITGFLLYNNHLFIQLLEGVEEDVKATYDRITKDVRHEHPIVLFQQHFEERSFKGYHSAFKVFNNEDTFNVFQEYIKEMSAIANDIHNQRFKIIEGIIKNM